MIPVTSALSPLARASHMVTTYQQGMLENTGIFGGFYLLGANPADYHSKFVALNYQMVNDLEFSSYRLTRHHLPQEILRSFLESMTQEATAGNATCSHANGQGATR